MVPFESALERDFLTFIARMPGLVRVSAQPFTLTWFDGGKKRRYTPDFEVLFKSVPSELALAGFAETTVIEVKYAADYQADTENIERRLRAVTEEKGVPAVLADENLIRGNSKRGAA